MTLEFSPKVFIPQGNMHLSEYQLICLGANVGEIGFITDKDFVYFGLQPAMTIGLRFQDDRSAAIHIDVLQPGRVDYSDAIHQAPVKPPCLLYEGRSEQSSENRKGRCCGIILPNGFVRHVWRDPEDVFTELLADALEVTADSDE